MTKKDYIVNIIEKYADGSFVAEITLETPDALGSKYQIQMCNFEGKPFKVYAYRDNSKSELIRTMEIIGDVTKEHTVKESYEDIVVGYPLWQSSVSERNENQRDIHVVYYSDKCFKEEAFEAYFEYDLDGKLTVEKCIDLAYEYGESKITTFDKNGRFLTETRFYDKRFKDMMQHSEFIYETDGSYCKKTVCHPDCGLIAMYNSEGNLISEKYYSDKSFKTLTATCFQTNNSDGTYVRKYIYEQPEDGVVTAIYKFDSEGNVLSEEKFPRLV